MKKQFFIFVGLVFCGLFGVPAFGVCSYDALKNWKPSDGEIDDFLKCESITRGKDSIKPIHVALATFDNTSYSGNYEAVKAMMEKNADIAKGLEAEWPSRSAVQMAIDNCCKKGNNETAKIVSLLIEKDPDAKNWFTKASMGNQETVNSIWEKKSTMLDYVRYKMKYVDGCKNATQCKEIEKVLVSAGAKTCEELRCDFSSNTAKMPIAGTVDTTESPQTSKTEENNADDANIKMDLKNIQPVSILSNISQENLEIPAEINIKASHQLNKESEQDEQNEKDLEEKQKAYDDAKANEQSTANKLLGGLSTAATGIGGMQALQGMAEQSADKDAMANMAAYIETMRCTYGDGKQVKAGPDEIELPGANDQELMNLRAEYLALAADLKERKAALGMKPGIESEVIMDRASTGLYDDENVGITSGNYESIYRAMMLGSESDQAKLDEQKNTSSNRVKYGAIAAGVGVVGGIVGNELINGKLSKKIKNAQEKKDKEKNEKQALEKLQKCLKDGGAKKTSDLKFENFTPSVLHLEKISCSDSDWKDKVKGKDATKLFADTTDEATIKDNMIDNFGVVIAGKLLDEDLHEKQQEQNQQQEQAGQEQIPVVTQQPEQEQNSQEEQKQEEPKQEEKKQEEEKQKTPQQKTTNQKKPQPKQEQKPQPKQEQKNDAGKVAERKTPKTNVAKTQENIKTFEDVQVNLEQGKKIVELWAAKNNKKNFSYKSRDISTVGQDYLTYQDDAHIYTFEFDDLTESMSGTRKEGIGTAVCLIYKGTPSTGADFIQCNNVNCSEFISAAQKIDSSIKGWSAPNLPYGQKTTMYTECRMSTF